MKNSAFNGLGGNKTGLTVYALMTGLMAYMIWIGVTGRPIPEWVLWATTVL